METRNVEKIIGGGRSGFGSTKAMKEKNKKREELALKRIRTRSVPFNPQIQKKNNVCANCR